MSELPTKRYGLIAGNGRFPFLVLEAAKRQGIEMVVAAIQEETFPEIEQHASRVQWLSIGQLSKLIDYFHREGVRYAIMAGQVKHKIIFSSIVPDWKLARVLMQLKRKNTDSLIGAVVNVLAEEGIMLMDSTALLKDLVAREGVLTQRAPTREEAADMEYGHQIARTVAALDLGQTIVVRDQACVAVEAMEGTDAAIRRAAELSGGSRLTVIKVSKPNQDMRFDVPVIGKATIELMAACHASALAIDADKTLLIDGDAVIESANRHGIALQAFKV